MKVKDLLPDDKDYRIARVKLHAKKKKKTNPKANKTGPMLNFIDVFHGVSGSGDTGGDPVGSII